MHQVHCEACIWLAPVDENIGHAAMSPSVDHWSTRSQEMAKWQGFSRVIEWLGQRVRCKLSSMAFMPLTPGGYEHDS